ncbi:hypothetical protein GTY65_30700 [Streptomyces sp. SID8379]|uniref:hypothetical protein n=1 Tax=unclassified Streptomyces TaxID=2593676 RepID=UPI0003678555|nr:MULTISPECIES: hypothetical protein [unclassified Streptomyces]MYW68412.1 hypothetical protein [Streptomyces sp. SID8379]
MNEELPVRVQVDGRLVEWKLLVEGDGPWVLTLRSPAGNECSAQGDDVFDVLRVLRAELAPRAVKICCNGARANVRPSGFASSYGSWMIYVLHRWRPVTVRDLVPTFDHCEPGLVGSVEEQDAYWERYLSDRGKWLKLINPVWWAYFLTASWGRPKFRPGP